MSVVFTAPKIVWPNGEEISIDTFQETVIYEGIDNVFIHGYITIIDTSFLSRTIVGGEKITFKFESPLEENKLERTFIIFGKTNEAITERGVRVLKYLFISEEGLKAAAISLNKAWDNNIPSIMEDIFQSLPLSEQPNGTKTFEKDTTNQNFKYIAPNVSTEEVIDRLTSVCFDAEGYPFVLYENIDGFFFKSFKTLLDQYKQDDLFVYSNIMQTASLPSIPVDTRAIIIEGIQVFRSFDLRTLLRRGALSTNILGFDFVNKQPVEPQYDITSRSPYDDNLGFSQFDEDTITKYTEDERMGQNIFIPVSSDSFMKDLAQNLAFKRAVGNLSSSIKIQFDQINAVYFHKTGDCVNLEFDNEVIRVGTDNQGTELGTKLSGRYLITRVAHTFSVVNTINYNKKVEAIKLGYGDSV